MVEKGKWEAIEAVWRVTAHAGAHMVRDNNPLGLPQGEEGRERHIRCNAFCTYLANRSELVQAFNGLSHLHQVFTLLLHKPREDEPHSVKEWFLRATRPQRHAAWQATIGRDGALERVQRESKLQHMEVFF